MKNKTFNLFDMFGISEEKGRAIEREFQHYNIDSPDMLSLAEKLDIVNCGEFGFKLFLWSMKLHENKRRDEANKFKSMFSLE